MEKAYYDNTSQLVTVEEFLRLAGADYAAKHIFPYCQGCGEILQIYGAHSTNVASRFDHQNRPEGLNPADDCPFARRKDSRYEGLKPGEWDQEQYEKVKRDFFTGENIKTAYSFMLALCRQGNLPVGVFDKCIRRADKKLYGLTKAYLCG
jgi:hypothetical protein